MTKSIMNGLQMLLHGSIAVVLSFVIEDLPYRWEFWAIMALVMLIRFVDSYYAYHE